MSPNIILTLTLYNACIDICMQKDEGEMTAAFTRSVA